ncbi:MAG: RNA pseudouridine synthase [Sphingobacteriia bacterium]|nr:RNA pseudouridine synthase [Sphingobacteriia bacterium]
MTEEEIQDLVIYRDALILVLNKPYGIPVHKGSGNITSLEPYFEHLKFGLPKLPSLAHRLDKDTTGCLVLGRHAQPLRELGKLFDQNKISKTYLALVVGRLPEQSGIITAPIAPLSDKKHHWWVKIDYEKGKESITEYEVIASNNDFTFVKLMPKTGRTHQLRIHMAHLGHHIYGDWIYGNPDYKISVPLHLHASQISIPLYKNKPSLNISAELPEHFKNSLDKFSLKNDN